MSEVFRKVERKVYSRKIRNKYEYRDVYTLLPEGEVTEYNYGRFSIYLPEEEDALINFFKKPYLILPQKDHSLVIVPSWIPLRVGWQVMMTESYNVYRVDRWALHAGLIPEEMREEFDFEPLFRSLKIAGDYLIGDRRELEDAWIRYKDDLLRREKGKGVRIKQGKLFSLARHLVEDGIIPWSQNPVETKYKWKTNLELRPYQEEALQFWLQNGFMVLIWPFGAGKTILAMKAISAVSGSTLIVVPSLSLVDQWVQALRKYFTEYPKPRIGIYTGEKREMGDIVVATYESSMKLRNEDWDLLVVDEAHHYPAPSYSRMSMFKRMWQLCLTGSPFREMGDTELIYALGGPPYGADWDMLFQEGWISKPPIFIHITDTKFAVLEQLLKKFKGRVLIFCDTIDIGKEASSLLKIPFVYGVHTLAKRKEIVSKHEKLICSRIFDEGIDIPDLIAIVELDMHFGSRRQEAQRVGRAMHSKEEGVEYHILMSKEELDKYGKRLYILFQKGFEIKIIEGV